VHANFILFEEITKSINPELYGKNMFSFVGNCQTTFQSGCAILHSPSSTSSPAFGDVSVLDMAILIGTQWYLILFLMCNSLTTYVHYF
jgi:hypothetical protein